MLEWVANFLAVVGEAAAFLRNRRERISLEKKREIRSAFRDLHFSEATISRVRGGKPIHGYAAIKLRDTEQRVSKALLLLRELVSEGELALKIEGLIKDVVSTKRHIRERILDAIRQGGADDLADQIVRFNTLLVELDSELLGTKLT